MQLAITAHTLTSAAGAGLDATDEALWTGRSGLKSNDLPLSELDTFIGRVPEADSFAWPDGTENWHSRNNALAALGLERDGFRDAVAAALRRFGSARVGVILGSSTSSIGRTEEGYRDLVDGTTMPPGFDQPDIHNPHSPSAFVAHWCGIDGPAMTISTACSSSAKVFASASRWLTAGFVDAVVVGGVDSLCLSVLHGFDSLELVSSARCRPFDARRDGINIGEAAGFALVTRRDDDADATLRLSGYGESADAYHMSHPHPEGLGARLAMEAALERAGLAPADIGYINLHGTASRANDTVEALAVDALFPHSTLVSSTKGWTGHTLGAAGIVEAVVCLRSLEAGRVPGTLNLTETDPDMAFPILKETQDASLSHVMSNSFGFGGSNCSLVFSRAGT